MFKNEQYKHPHEFYFYKFSDDPGIQIIEKVTNKIYSDEIAEFAMIVEGVGGYNNAKGQVYGFRDEFIKVGPKKTLDELKEKYPEYTIWKIQNIQ